MQISRQQGLQLFLWWVHMNSATQAQEQLESVASRSGGWGLKVDAYSYARWKSSFLFFLTRSYVAQAGL